MSNQIQQVRAQVFETNSSSTHSIALNTLTPLTKSTDYTITKDGAFHIPYYEFGWGYEEINEADLKAAYLYIYIQDWVRPKSSADADAYLDLFEKVIFTQTKATSFSFDPPDKWHGAGYIDHQSVESRDLDYLFASPEPLTNFVFCRNSILTLDNDNH